MGGRDCDGEEEEASGTLHYLGKLCQSYLRLNVRARGRQKDRERDARGRG